jgi:hypothetical protein
MVVKLTKTALQRFAAWLDWLFARKPKRDPVEHFPDEDE